MQDKFNENINRILPYVAFESRDGLTKPKMITIPRRCIQKSPAAERKETDLHKKIKEINEIKSNKT